MFDGAGITQFSRTADVITLIPQSTKYNARRRECVQRKLILHKIHSCIRTQYNKICAKRV